MPWVALAVRNGADLQRWHFGEIGHLVEVAQWCANELHTYSLFGISGVLLVMQISYCVVLYLFRRRSLFGHRMT